jgi:cell division protein ZapA
LKQSVEVTIAGQRFLLKSDGRGNGHHLRELADYVNAKLEEVRGVAKGLSPERLAILTALNIADDLMHQREEARKLRAEVRRRAETLLGYLRGLAAQPTNNEPQETARDSA